MLYSSYLGGYGRRCGMIGIAVDSGLSVYVTGSTSSTDFTLPTRHHSVPSHEPGLDRRLRGEIRNPVHGLHLHHHHRASDLLLLSGRFPHGRRFGHRCGYSAGRAHRGLDEFAELPASQQSHPRGLERAGGRIRGAHRYHRQLVDLAGSLRHIPGRQRRTILPPASPPTPKGTAMWPARPLRRTFPRPIPFKAGWPAVLAATPS